MKQDTKRFVEDLIREREDELKAFLSRRLPTSVDAADAYQEVLYRMCRVVDPSRIDNPQAFLFRSAINVIQDFYRKRREPSVPLGPEVSADLITEEPSPEQSLIGKEWWATYCAALEELTPKCRRVFVMCRMQNKSHIEIAEELQISTKMVEKYMTKALLHLRIRLHEFFEPGW